MTIPDIPVTGSNPWEFSTYIQTGSDVTSYQGILGLSAGIDCDTPILEIYLSKWRIFFSSNGSQNDIADGVYGTYTVLPDTWYYVKFGWDGITYYVDYSLDGSQFERDIAITSSLPIYQSKYKWALGNDLYGSGQIPFFGKMDLSKTSLRIGNEIVWQGVESAQPEEPEEPETPINQTYYCYSRGGSYQYMYTTVNEFEVGVPVIFYYYKDDPAYNGTSLPTSPSDFNRETEYTPDSITEDGFISGSHTFTRNSDFDFME